MRRILLTWAVLAIAACIPSMTRAQDANDKAVAEQIATVLRDSGQMKNYSVGVKYRNGTVWLSGRVTSQQQLQAALGVVSNLEGVEQIVNNMSVSAPSAGLRQPMSASNGMRRTSYAEQAQTATVPEAMMQPAANAGGDVVPAGYGRLGAKHKFMRPMAMYGGPPAGTPPPAYDNPHMPNYAWPSYAASPNYAALTYPKQYSATAFPFIGPFYPYPQVPLGWRKVSLEWDDGWWFLDFHDRGPY
ncbi:MAG: BON domain-containing protein [Pirellulales bacterium]